MEKISIDSMRPLFNIRLLYIVCLLLVFSMLGKILFDLSFSILLLPVLFLCHFFLLSTFFFNRFVSMIFTTFLVFFLLGYLGVKILNLVPPVDDNLALMFLLQTNWDEIQDFLSWQLIVVLLLALVISYFLVYPLSSRKNSLWALTLKTRVIVSLISFFFLFLLFPLVRSYLPYNLYNISMSFSWTIKDYRNSLTLRAPEKAPSIVYFIGESLRADHLSINGYKRKTLPLLEKRNLINFGMGYSCATYTKASWLYLTQRSDCAEVVPKQINMAQLFKSFGYNTYFAAPQDIKAQIDLLRDSDAGENIGRSEFRVDKRFQKLNMAPKSLVILGHRGSHYNYKAYPSQETIFQPICSTTNFVEMSKKCSVQEIVNDYDNTIIQLDKSIDGIIRSLEKRQDPVIFVYTSDHGEMLGEEGIWAHGFYPWLKETRLIPLFFWVNDAYKRMWPEKYAALLENSKRFSDQVRHDNLWFSLLDGAGVIQKNDSDSILNSQKSLFSLEYIPSLLKDWSSPDYPRN